MEERVMSNTTIIIGAILAALAVASYKLPADSKWRMPVDMAIAVCKYLLGTVASGMRAVRNRISSKP